MLWWSNIAFGEPFKRGRWMKRTWECVEWMDGDAHNKVRMLANTNHGLHLAPSIYGPSQGWYFAFYHVTHQKGCGCKSFLKNDWGKYMHGIKEYSRPSTLCPLLTACVWIIRKSSRHILYIIWTIQNPYFNHFKLHWKTPIIMFLPMHAYTRKMHE